MKLRLKKSDVIKINNKPVKPKKVKAKVVKEEILYVKKEIPYDIKNHGYLVVNTIKHTREITKPYKYTPSVNIYSMVTGCGLYALHGFTWMRNDNLKDAKEIMTKVLEYVGERTIIATLGDAYPQTQEIMSKLGFEKIASYVNPGHGKSTYQQHLYIIKNGKPKYE